MNFFLKGDSFRQLRKIQPNSIDLIITDPPYGIIDCSWDSKIDLAKLWDLLSPLLKPGGILIFTAQQPFTTDLINSKRRWFKYCMVWDKHFPRGFLCAKYRPLMRHEDIVIFAKPGPIQYFPVFTKGKCRTRTLDPAKKKGSRGDLVYELRGSKYKDGDKAISDKRHPVSIIQGYFDACQKGKFHPTQKPISLFAYLIRLYSQKGDLVLDPFAGAGTTALACIETDRRYICIEQDVSYARSAKSRIKQAMCEYA